MVKNLNVIAAGCLKTVAQLAVDKWNKTHDLEAKLTVGHSVDCIRKVLSGEPCDVLIMADDAIIESMMMPEYTDGCYVFAGNGMVVMAAPGKSIDSQNWKEKLLDRNAVIVHNDPCGDPGGYRAVMALMLADYVQDGLGDRLINHPGRKVQEGKGEYDYKITYRTTAMSSGADYAELPPQMNLSAEEYADIYKKAEIQVDEKNSVCGTPISHAVTIPFAAKHPQDAKEFIKLFLQSDFAKFGFIKKEKTIGKWEM